VKPCYDLRAEIAETQKRLLSLNAKCRDADASALKLTKCIIQAIKADPTQGENSPLCGAMGYVRASDRSGGFKHTCPGLAAAVREGQGGSHRMMKCGSTGTCRRRATPTGAHNSTTTTDSVSLSPFRAPRMPPSPARTHERRGTTLLC
jgi:hypothetical protein